MALDPKTIPYVVNRFGSTTLLDDILADTTTISLVDASSLPEGDLGGCIQIKQEVIVFERREINTLYGCRRGLDGSIATSHSRGDIVTSKIVALSFNSMKDAILELQTAVGNTQKKEKIVVTADMLVQKYLELQHTPTTEASIELTPAGGPMQIIGLDYLVSGNILSWDNMGLDGVLEAGDMIVILYDSE
jgi:hypothetical protein